MGLLQPDEVNFIVALLARCPSCSARRYARKVLFGPTPEDRLDIELFLKSNEDPCNEIWALRRAESYRRRRDPSIQEQDYKRQHLTGEEHP